jgi:hypothetical protein
MMMMMTIIVISRDHLTAAQPDEFGYMQFL